MFSARQQSGAGALSSLTVLIVAGFALSGCDAPPAADAIATSAPQQMTEVVGVVLRADPNPVPPGNPKGETLITWDTGSEAEGEVYVVSGKDEKLFGSGRQGSQAATWIPPGGVEFRLYTQGEHKLLARLTVTMFAPDGRTKRS